MSEGDSRVNTLERYCLSWVKQYSNWDCMNMSMFDTLLFSLRMREDIVIDSLSLIIDLCKLFKALHLSLLFVFIIN
jgi:hypothetical protein